LSLVDQAMLAAGIIASAGLYLWLAADGHPRLRLYLKSNCGAPFVVAFIMLLMAAAVMESLGIVGTANTLAEYAFFAILIGVVLQAVASRMARDEAPSDA